MQSALYKSAAYNTMLQASAVDWLLFAWRGAQVEHVQSQQVSKKLKPSMFAVRCRL